MPKRNPYAPTPQPPGKGEPKSGRADGLTWDESQQVWRNPKGHAVCGSKRSGRQTADGYPLRCASTHTNKDVPNGCIGRCNRHGGTSPVVGAAHPNSTTGRHSKYLNGRLKEAYEASLLDPQTLSLTPDIALMDARVADLLASGALAGSVEAWQAVRASFKAVKAAGDDESRRVAMDALADAVATGCNSDAGWNQVDRLVERRRRLVDSETRRLLGAQTAVTVEQLYVAGQTMAVQLIDLLKRYGVPPAGLNEAGAIIAAALGGQVRTLTVPGTAPGSPRATGATQPDGD